LTVNIPCLVPITPPRSSNIHRYPSFSNPFPYTTLFRSISGYCHWDSISKSVDLRRTSRALYQLTRRGVLLGQDPSREHHSARREDRKSTRLNSSHEWISYAVFCLLKKK